MSRSRTFGGVKPHAINRFSSFVPNWSKGKIRKFLRYCKECVDKDGRTGRAIIPDDLLIKAGLDIKQKLIMEYNFREIENVKFL
jgi:hypothetical protein